MNRVRFEVEVDSIPATVIIHYPYTGVFVVGPDAAGSPTREVFDYVYATPGFEIEHGQPADDLIDAIQAALPGHRVVVAMWLSDVLHVRTEDEYAFYVSVSGGRAAAARVLRALLRNEEPLAEAFCPAVGMRQLVHGEWLDSRRYCMASFLYHIAPVEDVRLELLGEPLRVLYYGDRVEVSKADDEVTLETRLTVGFDGVPEALSGIDGVVLRRGERRGVTFPYSDFLGGTTDINTKVVGVPPKSSLPVVLLSGRLALFPTTDEIIFATPGSGFFIVATARSAILDQILGVGPRTYLPDDERVPDWAVEDFYRRYPHRRPR